MSTINIKLLSRCYPTVLAGLSSLILISFLIRRKEGLPKSHYYHMTDIKDVEVVRDESIFFIEMSLFDKPEGTNLDLTVRTACAVESAVKLHPERDVYLIFATPREVTLKNPTQDFLSKLSSYRNMKINKVDLNTFIKHTPVENLLQRQAFQKSEHIRRYSADIIRMLLLWKYGGFYLDTEIMVLKNLKALDKNFISHEAFDDVQNAAMRFGRNSIGHNFTEEYLKIVSKSFSFPNWNTSSAFLFKNVLFEWCDGIKFTDEVTSCKGITICPRKLFYTVQFSHAIRPFHRYYTESILEELKYSYTVHLWNNLSHKAFPEDDTAVSTLASEKCPRVYGVAGHF